MQNSTLSIGVLWPFMAYAAIVVVLVSVILLLSYLLGQHHKEQATDQPYESGIEETGSARLRFSVQFYLVAMLFVIFDVETIFIVLWALHFKELGWVGYAGISLFIGVLIAVLIYEWSIGALDFGPSGKKILKAYRKQQNAAKEALYQQLFNQNNPR
ncbi:NADH-quinone oxidoreductase subunit A [Solitalea canadensis]|uniref:NADH-quinone oxidoreductase subunit A n=1 Tax=Solitalea canadensis (strain ATCC 29591 / DSM 3403 / JCM 21819 / LMG 8368 / NBRC 15130 / NCIMB 12057 / USAM 9D) TaxID=929556 RepID=H8KWJ3_SOLCM|nr:NADH-quinone oxidoreductase subunit A [Solitalea canadensis]AFD08111.1 NADH:ubiquinone oxidoreductase subunit 3 (chain A) [Solitalea canadensis DSM 3403]